jgi:hypothetical protein
MTVRIVESEDRDGLTREEMGIDGKEVLHVYPLCESPEDAIIGRGLVSCSEVAEFMKKAYDAGRRGEEFDIELEKGRED